MTAKEVAAEFRVSPTTVLKWARARARKIKSILLPGSQNIRRFNSTYIQELLSGGEECLQMGESD